MNWLAEHFDRLSLDEDHEGYFLGRGAKESTLQRLQVKTWRPLPSPSPDETFRYRYSPKPEYGGQGIGERLDGWALWPLYSPRGRVIGFAGRPVPQKEITRFLLPEAEWQPLFTGLTPETMAKIWNGADIWVVEGIFDLLPLEWAVPTEAVVLGSERARLTDKHIEFLRRHARHAGQRVYMVYDNDETGQKGVDGWVDDTGKSRWGALRRLSRVGVKPVKVTYSGKDPGEVWNRGGAAAVQATFTL